MTGKLHFIAGFQTFYVAVVRRENCNSDHLITVKVTVILIYFPPPSFLLSLLIYYLTAVYLSLFLLFFTRTLDLSTHLLYPPFCRLHPSQVTPAKSQLYVAERSTVYLHVLDYSKATEKETESISFNERDECKGVLVNHHMVYKLNK